MKIAELLMILQIFQLLRDYDGSCSATLLDALMKAVATESNIQLYIAAFIHLGAGHDFKEFLERPFKSFFEHMFVQLPVKLVQRFGLPSFTPHFDSMQSHEHEHPVDFLYRICKDAMCNARIPAGTRLVRYDGCLSHTIHSSHPQSHPDSIWGDICPKCGRGCKNPTHMDPRMGDYANNGRQMWWSFLSECSKEFFFMFCSEYAKFVCGIHSNPLLLTNTWTSTPSVQSFGKRHEFNLAIPFLPAFLKNMDFIRLLLNHFSIQETSDGNGKLVPRSFMYAIANNSGDRMKGAIAARLAKSLACDSGKFTRSVLRRVQHTPHPAKIAEFKAMNASFCKDVLRILKHFEKADMTDVFERLLELSRK
jgi:hypothetical protein